MKTQLVETRSSHSNVARRLCRIAPIAATTLALICLAFSTQSANAQDSDDGSMLTTRAPRSVPPPGGNVGADADEGIGTLPVVIGDGNDPDAPLFSLLPKNLLSSSEQPLPYLGLTGTWADVTAVVLSAGGEGVVTAIPVDDHPDSLYRFGFHGNVDLRLDMIELRLRRLKPTISTGGEFDGGTATVCANGGCSPAANLPAMNGLLSFKALLQGGILQQTPVKFVAVSTTQNSVTIDFSLLDLTVMGVVQRLN